jgi:exopolysaccharide production protein ExoZ
VPATRITVAPRVQPGRRLECVNELKGLAIVLVIAYHTQGLLGDPSTVHGEVGVDIFLILSGFTLAVNCADMPLGTFLRRRLMRIFPAYWAALAMTLYILAHVFNQTFATDNIVYHILGIHAFTKIPYFPAISDPFWFISMILAAYVVFACIRRHLDDLSLVCAVGGVLSAVATICYQRQGSPGGVYYLAARIPDFFAGLIAGRLLGAGTAEIKFNLLLALGMFCLYADTFILSVPDLYLLPAAGLIGAWVGLRPILARVLPGRLLLGAFSLLGVISYEVYLFHQPMIREYNSYVWARYFHTQPASHRQLLLGTAVGLAATVLLSAVLHAALGRGFARLGRRAPVRAAAVPA